MTEANYPSIADTIGNTPLVALQRIGVGDNTLLVKLEGNNPAGSVKDRPALSMINHAEARGDIKPGDTLIEATSGNTGIALAMAAAIKGYRFKIIMPENASQERRQIMRAYGAELILVSQEQGGMEGARDLAEDMAAKGEGIILNQFSNPDNPSAHQTGTGPEIWRDTKGNITHFVSSMGTTGTITGVSQYLKSQNPDIQIIGVRPATEKDDIPGIRRWSPEYLPEIFSKAIVDQTIDVTQAESENMMRRMAREEGIFCGISSGGAVAAALKLCETLKSATVVCIICDRGDRYISTGVFDTQ